MAKRKVIPECAVEGEILERARLSRKASDPRYTQKYLAGLVDKDQGYWTQWRTGTTRILDEYWLVFARELGFDPFQTRPELLDTHRLISGFIENGEGESSAADRTTKSKVTRKELESMLSQMTADQMRQALIAAAGNLSARDLLRTAKALIVLAGKHL